MIVRNVPAHGSGVPPGEPTPAEAVPAEAVPAEAVPAEPTPGEATPGEAMPGGANPAPNGQAPHAVEPEDQSDRTMGLYLFHSAAWLAPSGRQLAGSTVDERPAPTEAAGAISALLPALGLRQVATLVARIFPWAPTALLPLAIALWASALPTIDLSRMNDYGLVSVLPARVWAGFAVLMVSFVVCWWRADRTRLLLTVHILALIVMFYGIPSIVADSPRGPIVYRHAGITEYLARTGLVDTRQDAYFSWPAFFMFLSTVVKIGDLPSALTLATWATVVVNVLYLPLLLMIMRALTRDARLVWGAVLVFYVTNWINQDYLAPQSFTYLFYLAVIALVLHYLRPQTVADLGSLRVATRVRRSRVTSWAGWLFPVRPAPAPEGVQGATTGRTGALVTLVIIVLFGAATASHQLTPYAIFLAVTLLVVTGHCRVRGLPVLLGVILVTWTIFVAHGYIDGHLERIAEGSGLGQSASANVTRRLAGSEQHVVVVRERLMLSAWVWLLALLGGIYRFRTRHTDHAAAVLAVAPIPLFLLPYGGEVLLRLYFFMLPFVAFFAAALLVPPETRHAGAGASGRPAILRTVRDAVIFGLVGSLLLVASFLARYGNERMDAYSPAETAAVHELYRIAPLGSYLLAETNYLPWKYQDYEWSKADPKRRRHKYLSLANEWSLEPTKSVGDMVKWAAQSLRANATLKRPAGYMILTRSQRAHEEILGGLAPSTLDEFEMLLRRSGKFQLVYANGDAKIYARKAGK
jgi:hypothetical protein